MGKVMGLAVPSTFYGGTTEGGSGPLKSVAEPREFSVDTRRDSMQLAISVTNTADRRSTYLWRIGSNFVAVH